MLTIAGGILLAIAILIALPWVFAGLQALWFMFVALVSPSKTSPENNRTAEFSCSNPQYHEGCNTESCELAHAERYGLIARTAR